MIHPKKAQSAADVGGHYDELDETYRRIWGEHVHHGYWRTGGESDREATEALVELVAERLDLRPGLAVVDIGCGYGASAEYLALHYRVEVTGFTISAAQARIAEARMPAAGNFTAFHRDWLDNGLADASMDRAFAIESSEHMVDKARFFAEAFRVLRPGGRLVVCAWLSAPDPGRLAIRHLLEPICREGRLPGMGSRADYEALAGEAGFTLTAYDDISREVRRTWSICAGRVMRRLATDRAFRHFALDRGTKNRSFLLSVPRLMLALRTGAMRYGVFVWRKPA
ncbi:MAG TPA: class I SAM-dependent methyltransferase [Allosphingosinicella sp.]